MSHKESARQSRGQGGTDIGRSCALLQRLQILDQVVDLTAVEAEAEERVVMLDYIGESGEAPVVIEAALGVRPQAAERRSAITAIGRAIGLEIVCTNFLALMHVPTRLSEERRNVASGAFRDAIKEFFAALGCFVIKTVGGRLGRENRELIKVQSGELRTDEVGLVGDVSEAGAGGNGEFRGIIEAGIKKSAAAVHFEIGDESVPVGHGAPAGPRVEVDADETKRRRN